MRGGLRWREENMGTMMSESVDAITWDATRNGGLFLFGVTKMACGGNEGDFGKKRRGRQTGQQEEANSLHIIIDRILGN